MKARKPSCTSLARENRRLAQELARARAVVDTLMLTSGPIELNRLERTVWVGADEIPLGNHHFRILEQLMLHQGEVLSTQTLCELGITAGTLPVLVHQLRQRLGDAGLLIQVARGQGYTIAEGRIP